MEDKNQKTNSALREEEVLKFWKEKDIFKKSLEKDSPRGNYVFYDGPPFATGVPHYGHILGSTVKDVIGRYQTMQGFSVPRRWGWDCHGLPIENIVEKDLGISGKKAIEELGIDKFVEHAKSKVLTYVGEWRKTIDRMGRWVDFDNSYKTMDNTFIESVWWALGELNNKGLLYEGVRVLAYCPRCETPIANSEIAMDNSYKDITDISVYVKFKLAEVENTYLLAWTTTPWTLPGNTAIAINNEITYIYVLNNGVNGKETLIIAKERFEFLKDKFTNPEILREVKGTELVGLSYLPLFPYYKDVDIPNKENIWKVWNADFVTLDMGTGIAHEAPAFGEDDMNLARANNIPFIRHVEPNGVFSKEVIDFAGIKVKPKEDSQAADILIIKYLAPMNKLFAKEKIVHSYPHCYRCETPLIYYALPSWFINIQKVKEGLLNDAKSINWVPSHLKNGRFKNIMESAPDWTISRNRYWASPLPFWKSKSGKIMFVSGIDDLKSKTKKSGNKYFVMRHGETECNVRGEVSSTVNNDDSLTKLGIDQVEKTSELIKNKNIDIIITSPFVRTRESAELLADKIEFNKENLVFDDRLHEMSVPMYEGKKWSEYRADYPISVKNFYEAPEGNESYEDVRRRSMSFLYDIENRYSGKNILIITHGSPAWLMYSAVNNLSISETLGIVKNEKNYNYMKNGDFIELPFIPQPHNHNYELDLHRPYIDSIVLLDKEGEEYYRVPEVIDCWFESGSMPFAQDHYPFENKEWKEKNFPSGFVAEYIAQTRTWFYYTHTISSILFNSAPFENVVTTGTVLAEDGQKMSKSKNNFPDPWIIFNKFGVDALRFYLMASPVMKGEDINFSEKGVQDVSSKIINRMENVVTFYELYRDVFLESNENSQSENILDKWIMYRFSQLVLDMTNAMESYDMSLATKPVEIFINDLSTWYLRRSRERIKDQDIKAKKTLYFVLKNISKLIAPFTPFFAEYMWLKLKLKDDEESVHLTDWPVFSNLDNSQIISDMQKVREIVSLGLEARQKAEIKVRQPLKELIITNYELGIEYQEIIKEELNVKGVKFEKGEELKVELDTNITEELKKEGQYRELLRGVQDLRKKQGLNPNDVVTLYIETNVGGQELINSFNQEEFKKIIGAKEIKIKENDGIKINIDEFEFKIVIEK